MVPSSWLTSRLLKKPSAPGPVVVIHFLHLTTLSEVKLVRGHIEQRWSQAQMKVR